MDAAKEILAGVRGHLGAHKTDIENLLNNEAASQWKKINFETHASTLKFFGLSTKKLKEATFNYPKSAKEILTQIAKIENEIGRIETDIRLQSITPEKAELQAKTIENGLEPINQSMNTLIDYGNTLILGNQTLHDQLSFHGIFELAKNKTKNPKTFEAGFDFYNFVRAENTTNDDAISIYKILAEATRQGKLLEKIDLTAFAGAIPVIINNQIVIALKVVEHIKNFINDFKKNPPRGFVPTDECREKIISLKQADIKQILDNTAEVVKTMVKSITELGHRSHNMELFEKASVILEEINLFQRTIKNDLLEDIDTQIQSTTSPLSPSALAIEKSEEYFTGLAGLVRSVKLMLSSHKISKEELQQKLIDAIQTCDIFYGDKESNARFLKNFINNYIEPYDKPFPYDGLFELFKKSLNTYGINMHKYVAHYKLKKQTLAEVAPEAASAAPTLSKLIEKVKEQAKTLKK